MSGPTRAGRGARRGVALLLVLWLVVVLGAIGTTVAVTVRGRLRVAGNLRDRAVARAAAESGVLAASQAIGDSLAALGEGAARRAYLDALEGTPAPEEALGDARFRTALVDPSARLDVNAASEEALARFFAPFAGAAAARDVAREIRERVGGGRPGEVATPFLSVDALGTVRSLAPRVAEAAAPYLTVDGDGSVNRLTAPPPVRAAAAGQLVDEPTRLVIVSRGWRAGAALTHEIQAVYAVQGAQLALVRWRERDL